MTISISEALDMARYAIALILQLSAPTLLVGMVVGLIISIVQAVTQIQEQTLTFVPKMIAMAIMAVLMASWAMTKIMEFSKEMFVFANFR
ncbi:MAG: flagellar biosynthesis protein FliQ [Phycisphaerae bacterium]|jgi:flagellar biosynthetic protein FliQ|nr:flagellar biosynthesis protein FliQ [Phycisphaerae bacterium]